VIGVLNWPGILLGVLLTMVMGWVWYGRMFFDAWLESQNRKKEDISASPMPGTITQTGAMLVLGMVLALYHHGQLLLPGAILTWLLFMLAPLAGYLFEERSLQLWGINAGHDSLAILIFCGVIVWV